MKASPDSLLFLNKAKEDLVILTKHESDQEVSDSIWGFHAHQTIEKTIKSILSYHKIEFPKTHDLLFLKDILDENQLQINLKEDVLEVLTPFSVTFRYDNYQDEPLDRTELYKSVLAFVREVESKFTIA